MEATKKMYLRNICELAMYLDRRPIGHRTKWQQCNWKYTEADNPKGLIIIQPAGSITRACERTVLRRN